MVRVFLLSIAFSLCASVVSAQSVADAARQTKKDTDAAKTPKKVYTTDDVSSAQPDSSPLDLGALDALDHEIEELDGMDGPAVARLVLGEKLDVPFDGRRDWEYKMLDAKKELVLSEKEILRELRRLRDGRQFEASGPVAALRAALQKARAVENEGRALARAWLLRSR
jgi:hypothetical protein